MDKNKNKTVKDKFIMENSGTFDQTKLFGVSCIIFKDYY